MADTSPLTFGTRTNDAHDFVTADQRTIVGSGTSDDVLAAGAGIVGQFFASFSDANGAAGLGRPVFNGAVGPSPSVLLGQAQAPTGPLVVGLIAQIVPGGVIVQYAGPLTLSTADWDLVTGGGGGLTQGAPYLVAAGSFGGLTTTAPGPGNFIVQAGGALSPTTLLINLPTNPLRV